MGWLDKLLGRDKQDAGEPAGTSTRMESGTEPAEEPDPHAGHDHPPGEHPHEEHS